MYITPMMNTTRPLAYDELPGLLTMMTGDEKHSSSATSTLDVIWVLYDRILKFDSGEPKHPERDRFLLSKGHSPMAYYAVLADISSALFRRHGLHRSLLLYSAAI